MQLSANVDMQYVVSQRRVTKYATKSDPRSKSLKTVYSTIMKSLKDDDKSLKVVQMILINSVGERNYSAQETCHLLQLTLYYDTRDFVILSLDGSREVDNKLDEGKVVTHIWTTTVLTAEFQDLTILQFVKRYRIPERIGDDLVHRNKEVVVLVCPYCSPDPEGPKEAHDSPTILPSG